MKLFFKIFAGIVLLIIVCLGAFIIVKTFDVKKGKVLAEQEYQNKRCTLLENTGSIKNLSITPLIDFVSMDPALKTEAGVSYLIRADNTVILMDVGYNQNGAHPSLLLQNMEKLSIKINDIDILYFSHPHMDHVGGMNEAEKQTFSLTRGKLDMLKMTAYSPTEMKQSEMTPVGKIIVNQEPFIIKPGIASIGAIPVIFLWRAKYMNKVLQSMSAGKELS